MEPKFTAQKIKRRLALEWLVLLGLIILSIVAGTITFGIQKYSYSREANRLIAAYPKIIEGQKSLASDALPIEEKLKAGQSLDNLSDQERKILTRKATLESLELKSLEYQAGSDSPAFETYVGIAFLFVLPAYLLFGLVRFTIWSVRTVRAKGVL